MRSVACWSTFRTSPWMTQCYIIHIILCLWMFFLRVQDTLLTTLCVCLCRKAVMRRMSTCCRPSCVLGVTTWIKSRPVCSVETAETAKCVKPSPVPPSAMLMGSTDEPLTNTPQTALTERTSQGPWTLTSDNTETQLRRQRGRPVSFGKRRDTWT